MRDISYFHNNFHIKTMPGPFLYKNYAVSSDGVIIIFIEKKYLNTELYKKDKITDDIKLIPEGIVNQLKEFESFNNEIKNCKREKIDVNELVECKECNGKKVINKCTECDGDGSVLYFYYDKTGTEYEEIFDCPICYGKGNFNVKNKDSEKEPCHFCEGTGFDRKENRKEIINRSMNMSYIKKINDFFNNNVEYYTEIGGQHDPLFFKHKHGFGAVMPVLRRS